MKNALLLLATATLLFAQTSCNNEGEGNTAGGGDAIDLKLNLQPGKTYAYTTETDMEIEQSMMGQNIKTENNSTMVYNYDVTAGEGNGKDIKVTYTRVSTKMKNAMMNMEYDSADSTKNNSEMKGMGKMVGKSFTMKVNEQGEINEIMGLDELMQTDDAVANAQMKTMFNDTAMRGLMQQSLNVFPGKAVKPGDTWTKTYTLDMAFMQMNMNTTYTLKSVSDGIAHLDMDTKIDGNGASNTGQMKGLNMNLKGDAKGTMDVMVASGLIKESEIKQEINGDVSMQGMKIPMKIKGTTKIMGKEL